MSRTYRCSRCSLSLAETAVIATAAPTKSVTDTPLGTNPIAVARVSGLAQSGFNEVAHSAKPDAHRRATSQNPPDSQEAESVIQADHW